MAHVRASVSLGYEWPTLVMLTFCYALWAAGLFFISDFSVLLAITLLIPSITLHSSLQHETLHILEPRWPILGMLAIFPAIGLFIPYIRFRDTHLAHHQNEFLTDPLDDPESFYLLPEIWERLPNALKAVLRFNNTLIGRMLLGPVIGQTVFMASDAKQILQGNTSILKAWFWHLPAAALVIGLIALSPMPFWGYLLAAYGGLSVLKIRTFLEHRAEEQANGRSVIVEDRGPLAWLFLNNNYHAAHHAHPSIPWYTLPRFFRENRDKFLAQNRGYYYPNYRAVFRQFFVNEKEPVPHPIWSLQNRRGR